MTLSYSLRLVCICFASLFLIHAVLVLSVEIAARRAIALARGMTPRVASRCLFAVRMLPLILAGVAVFGFCLPSYLLLEPQTASEQVGWPCVAIALLGAAMCAGSIVRMAKAAWRSAQLGRTWRKCGRETQVGRERFAAIVVHQRQPMLAVAGIVRPRLVISQGVLQALSAEELNAALLHERAHRIWRDNFKRLLFIAAPRPFGITSGLRALEGQWSKFAEWAADDHAAASDTRCALFLAAALVRVARLGLAAPHPAIVSPFVDGSDLSERVDRLLHGATVLPRPSGGMRLLRASAAAVAACSLVAMMLWPASVSAVHQILERLVG